MIFLLEELYNETDIITHFVSPKPAVFKHICKQTHWCKNHVIIFASLAFLIVSIEILNSHIVYNYFSKEMFKFERLNTLSLGKRNDKFKSGACQVHVKSILSMRFNLVYSNLSRNNDVILRLIAFNNYISFGKNSIILIKISIHSHILHILAQIRINLTS